MNPLGRPSADVHSEISGTDQRPVDGGEQLILSLHHHCDLVMLDVPGEPDLMIVDVLTELGISGHHDRQPTGHPGVHDGGRTGVAR